MIIAFLILMAFVGAVLAGLHVGMRDARKYYDRSR